MSRILLAAAFCAISGGVALAANGTPSATGGGRGGGAPSPAAGAPAGRSGGSGARALSPGTVAPQPTIPNAPPAGAIPPPNSPLALTPTMPAPTLAAPSNRLQPAPPNPLQPANPSQNLSIQRAPEIGNPTPPIGARQYQDSVPPLQSMGIGGRSSSSGPSASSPNSATPENSSILRGDYDRCIAMWGAKTTGSLTTRRDWEASCRSAVGKR